MSALGTLLAGLVDYAGLFPPAGLEMEAAVAEYARHRESAEAFMLGRFVVPVKRLEAWAACRGSVGTPWPLSVLVGDPTEYEALQRFREAFAGVATVDTIEVRAGDADEVARWFVALPPGLTVYVELPLTADDALLRAVLAHGGRAKVRTGGLTAEAFPSCAALAGFLDGCTRVGVPFKATAGLHHPLRSERAVGSGRAMMHGFLNVFLAAALLRGGGGVEEAARLLEETDWTSLTFSENTIGWRGHVLTADRLASSRDDFAVSFGSCSFDEPVDDLKERHLL